MEDHIEITNTHTFNNLFLNILIKTDKNEIKVVNNQLSDVKDKITQYSRDKKWDFYKKITNPYELIYLTKRLDKPFSISKYEPISRSYFKMIEMLYEFMVEYKYKRESIRTFHLAEGPGGFVEAMINFRNNNKDNVYAISLVSDNKNIPNWNKINHFMKNNNNIKIIIGEDKKGDLYNVNNHYYIMENYGKNSMDIMTGDGGFDFSRDYNSQEQNSQKLIFSQILMTFSMLKINGNFICKFFDTYCDLTKEFIFLLYLFFDKVYIYKPNTSRIANSERYIICNGFKGCKKLLLCELLNILSIWNKIEKIDYKINNIIDFNNNNKIKNEYEKFKHKLNKINQNLEQKQINNINYTIELIENKPNEKCLYDNYINQIKIAKDWCNKYSIPYKYNFNNKNYKNLYYLFK